MCVAVPIQALSSSLKGNLFSPPARSYTNGAFCVPMPRGCITGGVDTVQRRALTTVVGLHQLVLCCSTASCAAQ